MFQELDFIPATSTLGNWVLKFSLDKTKMMDKNIRMSDIYFAIISKFNVDQQDIRCVFSDDNSSELIMRIQLIEKLCCGNII